MLDWEPIPGKVDESLSGRDAYLCICMSPVSSIQDSSSLSKVTFDDPPLPYLFFCHGGLRAHGGVGERS